MATAIPKPRNTYSPRLSVKSPKGHTPAQQQFKDDCNINVIMHRLTKDDAVDHVSAYQKEYGFHSPLDYHQSMNLITHADSMFNDLPSKLRNEFSNSPQAFLEFVQDPKNHDRALELNITLSDKAEAAWIASQPVKTKAPPDTDEAKGNAEGEP